MIVGFLIIGMIAGLIAGGLSLLSGATFGWAFVAYMVTGNVAMVLAGLVVAFRHTPPDVSSGTADHPQADNRNARPAPPRRALGQSARNAAASRDKRRPSAHATDRDGRIRH